MLAKVMSQANEYDPIQGQVRRWPGHQSADLGEPTGQAAASRADRAGAGRALALGHPAGGAGRAGAARRDEPRGPGRAREGATTLHDARHRRSGGLPPCDARSPSQRPAAGSAHSNGGGPRPGEQGPPPPRRMAGEAAHGADSPGTGHLAGSSPDLGEAKPVLTVAPGPAAQPHPPEPAALPRPSPGRAGRMRTFRSLATRNYRLFAAGQVISNTGTWMQRVAQDWLVLNLTHGSGTALGIATGLQFLPQLLFSLWGGVIADRYPKRRILFVTQAAMGALALILGVLALTGVVTVWQVYLLAFALGMVAVVDNPTRQTFVAEMVGRTGMANAIALNSAAFNLARITGPAVAGLVIRAVRTPAAFLVNAASFGAVWAGLKLMRPAELHPLERVPRARGQLREAFRYVRARPELWLALVLVFFVATFGMNFQVTTALMSRGVFHTGASEFGL